MVPEEEYQYREEVASAYAAKDKLKFTHFYLEPSDKIELLHGILGSMNEDAIVDVLYYLDTPQAQRIAYKLLNKRITK